MDAEVDNRQAFPNKGPSTLLLPRPIPGQMDSSICGGDGGGQRS